ncbi:Putative major facilitator, sugar transporter, major facilitator superfamily [Septoria linicola]|uniref:Major facilitator, sugar transporter, major facilitator superfamily n=1 Tax=Septoria linicola TaxID=215465 RepID=A0A9Q9AQY3_9PEZI|nr:Putative major facilitator, sugar transporter, major facilitator superfamily [Septoria linicola]
MPFTIKPPEGTAGKAWPAIAVGLFVAFGGVLFGYDTGTIGGILAMPYWLQEFSTGAVDEKGNPAITASQSSEIVSLLSAGTFFGALTAAPTGDFFGRRWGLIVSTLVFTVGVILQTAATDIPLFVAGRFFAGYGVGMISALIPLYQSETAPKWIRGSIVGAYQLAITIGLLLAAIVDNATKDRNDSGSYRIPIAVQFAWALILVGGMLMLPETPRMWIKRGRPEMAAKALSTLRRLDVDHPALVEELGEITANHEYEMSLGQASYLDCFKGNLGKRLFTGCGLQALQQLTGVNFIFYYGTSFFTNSGITNSFIVSMITSSVNVASTFPGLYMVETWGRRNLLLFGAIGMAVCQFIVAGVGTGAGIENLVAQKALIAFVCIYIFFFACSWGPCAWVVTGEIFPLKVRAKSLSMTTASNWLLNWAIAYATPYMVNSGPGNANLQSKVFFVWGSFCFVCIFFVWALIYETKGLSLEQVDELYAKVDKAWQSPGFVPSVSFQDVQDIQHDARKSSLTDLENVAMRKESVGHEEKAFQ